MEQLVAYSESSDDEVTEDQTKTKRHQITASPHHCCPDSKNEFSSDYSSLRENGVCSSILKNHTEGSHAQAGLSCRNEELFSINNAVQEQRGDKPPIHSDNGDCEQISSSDSTAGYQGANDDKIVARSAPASIRETYTPNRKRSAEVESLGLPVSIKRMFGRSQHNHVDDPALHDGRLRSFPHEYGNWATHVFIPVHRDNHMMAFVNDLVHFLLPGQFELLPEFHVSLSQTVVIRHHWIDPLVDSLRQELGKLPASVCDIVGVRLYTNDEKTRTFVCLELAEEDTELVNYVTAVDKCFKGFKLAQYYQNPSFHISVGWCLGDVARSVSHEKLLKAKNLVSQFTAAHPDLSIVYARRVSCRSGNKLFVLPLKESAPCI